MLQKYKISYTYASITAKMPHFLGVGGGNLCCFLGTYIGVYRVSIVYLT